MINANNYLMDLATKQHRKLIDRMVRVDHAGEYAAKRIYQGQLSVLKGHEAELVEEMLASELVHLDYFDQQIKKRKTRPSILLPIVHAVAYGLGVASAKLGNKSAMACTIAVEEVIAGHYQEQLDQLGDEDVELSNNITRFKQEESEHQDIAQRHDGKNAVGYELLSAIVRGGCRVAIKLANYL